MILKKFQNTFIWVLVVGLILVSCDEDDTIQGSTRIISEIRTVNSFERVQVSDIVFTNILYADTLRVTARGNDNVIERITTSVDNNTLAIGANLNGSNFNNIAMEVTVEIPVLTHIYADGIANISVDGFENLKELTIDNNGVSNIQAIGSARKLNMDLSGTGNFEGFEFVVDTCYIRLSGVGNAAITVNQLLSGELSGVGNMLYQGNPTIQISETGIGQLINSN
ncbi:MAG: DUF2807 domain-containing protein [Cyclobacteriaceae bacterium]|nr:DUF2807 domain-containing protein [Cyclobacteriaceae bacterium HetDA_MAG_MS6]